MVISVASRLAPLRSDLRAVVVYAEEIHGSRHVFGSPDMVAHDARETAPVRFRQAVRDQLVVHVSREWEIGHAVVVNVPDLTPPKSVDGGWS